MELIDTAIQLVCACWGYKGSLSQWSLLQSCIVQVRAHHWFSIWARVHGWMGSELWGCWKLNVIHVFSWILYLMMHLIKAAQWQCHLGYERQAETLALRINLQQNFNKQPWTDSFLLLWIWSHRGIWRIDEVFFTPVCVGQYSIWLQPPICWCEKPDWTLKKKPKPVNQFELPYEFLTVANKFIFYSVTLFNSKY